MSQLKIDGYDLRSGWFTTETISELTSELDTYIKKFTNSQFTPFSQEVSTSLLSKDKTHTRQLYVDIAHKEAFFIKRDNSFDLVNLMDPHKYLKSISTILLNSQLNQYVNLIDSRYRFKNSIFFFKNRQDNKIIDWHRDSARSVVNKLILGIYLEDSAPGIDAVKYLPGTHLIDNVQIDESKAIEVPAKKGDCVIHFGSVFHMSPEYTENKIRRTLYLKYNLSS